MKKVFLMLAVAAFSAQAISAQTVEESENQDNWYVGIKAGASAKTQVFQYSTTLTLLPEFV